MVWIPRHLLPEVADLAIPALGEWIAQRHVTDLLRVQTLDHYTVASDGDDLRRYLAGEAHPTAPAKAAWLAKLREDADRGRMRRNVHVVGEHLTDYLRYQFEWCYTHNVAAGQDIRILDASRPRVLRRLHSHRGR